MSTLHTLLTAGRYLAPGITEHGDCCRARYGVLPRTAMGVAAGRRYKLLHAYAWNRAQR